jgi:hypothetical protein
MKKTYVKPYVAMETFQLDAAIATSCSGDGLIALGYAQDTCAKYDLFETLTYFGDACGRRENGTDVTDPGADANDKLCYHGPIPGVFDMFMNS